MRWQRTSESRQVEAGYALLLAIMMLAILSLVGANILVALSSRYNYAHKSVGWSDALNAAEAGADDGFANCRQTVIATGTAWTNWKNYDSTMSNWVTLVGTADGNAELLAGRTLIYDLPSRSHLRTSGEGTNDLWYHVEVDSPASFVVSGNRWYRIRATGYAAVPGLARVNNDGPYGAHSHNELLRKFDLRIDHFISRYGDYAHPAGTRVAVSPQAARRVETLARPATPFGRAIMAMATAGTGVSGPLIDSFDSTDSVHYPGGTYDSSSRNLTAGIGTNATVYSNAPISTFNSTLYGNLETNGGTVTKGHGGSHVTGSIINTVSIVLPPVTAPSWAVTASTAAPATITAGTTASPSYASFTKIDGITVTLPVGTTTGVANIYVTGDVTGGITVQPGVTVNIWFEGNFSMKRAAIDNLNNNAANLQLYGIDPPAGQTRSFDIGSGPPGISYFSLYAPSYDFTVNGNPDFAGSWVIKTLSGNGNTSWHYDEALATAGAALDYERASWAEDPR